MVYNYGFSDLKYSRKMMLPIMGIGIIVAAFLCGIVYMNGKLNIVAALVIFVLCISIAYIMFWGNKNKWAKSKLFFDNSILNFIHVKADGYDHDFDYRYKAVQYIVRRIGSFTVTSSSITIMGHIEQRVVTKTRIGSSVESNVVNYVTIPNYFENREHLIKTIQYLGGK